MSNSTPEIFEVLAAAMVWPYPDEPRSPGVWDKIALPRPCFDQMMAASNIDPGSRPDLMVFALAKELHRRGYSVYAIEKECIRFNNNNLRSRLANSSIRSILRDYPKRDHYHACDNWVLQKFCVGHEKCEWVKAAKYQDHTTQNDIEYFETNYSRLLKLPVKQVYKYFLELEQRLRLRPGQSIMRSYRHITNDLKFPDKGIVQRACNKLQEFGLIEIVSSGKYGNEATGLASIFCRIHPIPPPTIQPKENFYADKIQPETRLP
jgi:hypothetical protein